MRRFHIKHKPVHDHECDNTPIFDRPFDISHCTCQMCYESNDCVVYRNIIMYGVPLRESAFSFRRVINELKHSYDKSLH